MRWREAAVVAVACGAAWPVAATAQDSLGGAPRPPSPAAAPADSACATCAPKRPLKAALEGLAVNVFLNRFDDWIRNAYNPWEGYWSRVGPRTWSANLRYGWEWDTDDFMTNMFSHPINGSAYFRAGRQNGLDFWESTPLPFLGSAEWEYFGETARPSLNDFYNTSFGGIVLGEMTFRLAALVRDNEAHGTGRVLRELAALPLDPLGGIKRLLAGDWTRRSTNPREREPGALALELRGGARLAVDSGSDRHRSVESVLDADLTYGDVFDKPYRVPFDAFEARLLLGAGGNPVNELHVTGRLFAHEFTMKSNDLRMIFTVGQRIEYSGNPAYKFGGQSIVVGLQAGVTLGDNFDVRAAGYGEGIMLGAVDAPGAGIDSSRRTYDFGPGVGFDIGASLRYRTFPVLSLRWQGALVHSVSGSPADHFTHLPSVEIGVPLTRTLALGAYGGWYTRRSAYAGSPGEATTYPDLRVYLVWQTDARPGKRQTP